MLNALDCLSKDDFIGNRRYGETGSPANLRRTLAKFGRFKVCLFALEPTFVQWELKNNLSMYALLKAQANIASRLKKSLLDTSVYQWDQVFYPFAKEDRIGPRQSLRTLALSTAWRECAQPF